MPPRTPTPRPPSHLQRLVEELEPDTVFDAADLGTAFGMECSLAEQEAADELVPGDLGDD
jgi:hypothetical protein